MSGARGTDGFRGLPLGSVSHAVAHAARCPVAIVRTRAEHVHAGRRPGRLPRLLTRGDRRAAQDISRRWLAAEGERGQQVGADVQRQDLQHAQREGHLSGGQHRQRDELIG
jgi:hypothetical protein